MGVPKWKGSVGLAIASDASTRVAPTVFPICDSGNIEGEPKTYEAKNSITPDVIAIEEAGHDFKWSVGGIEPTAKMFGWLWAVALGSDAFATDTHTITPDDDSKYLCPSIDKGVDLGSSTPTMSGLGGKVGSLSFEIADGGFATMEASGLLCDLDSTYYTALSPSIVSTKFRKPISWEWLKHASASFAVGYAGGASSADKNITGLKVNYSRAQKGTGISANSEQPTGITEGMRELTFEITKEFDANATDAFDAWIGQTGSVAISMTLYADTDQQVSLVIPNATIAGSFGDEVGAGEDTITATLSCKAFQDASDPLVIITVKDDTTGVYT